MDGVIGEAQEQAVSYGVQGAVCSCSFSVAKAAAPRFLWQSFCRAVWQRWRAHKPPVISGQSQDLSCCCCHCAKGVIGVAQVPALWLSGGTGREWKLCSVLVSSLCPNIAVMASQGWAVGEALRVSCSWQHLEEFCVFFLSFENLCEWPTFMAGDADVAAAPPGASEVYGGHGQSGVAQDYEFCNISLLVADRRSVSQVRAVVSGWDLSSAWVHRCHQSCVWLILGFPAFMWLNIWFWADHSARMVESSNFNNIALFPSYISVRCLYQNVWIALNGATAEMIRFWQHCCNMRQSSECLKTRFFCFCQSGIPGSLVGKKEKVELKQNPIL